MLLSSREYWKRLIFWILQDKLRTDTALVTLADDLYQELDRRNRILLVLLDISAAFDTVNHSILLSLVLALGHVTVVQVLSSGHLRRQCWGILALANRVPQESVLSSMLYNIYMKLLEEVIRRLGLWYHQYKDDSKLLSFFST